MAQDDVLYRRFLDGDISAIDELYLQYRFELINYLTVILHDDHDAEDMMIESFARIMAKRPGIHEGHFKAYLFRVARNLAFRFMDKNRKNEAFSLKEEALPEYRSPEDMFDTEEKREILHRLMKDLDPKVREVLYTFFFENMSYAQISEIMGISTKKVDNLLMKGKKLLKPELEKAGVTHSRG